MDTTRPLDNTILNKEMTTKAVRPVEATPDAVSAKQTGDITPSALELAESFQATGQVMEAGLAEVRSLDDRVLGELKAQIENGTFKVDLDVLTDRMVSDAFGDLA